MTFTATFTALLQREAFTVPLNLHGSTQNPLSLPSRLPSRASRATPFTFLPPSIEGENGGEGVSEGDRGMKIRADRREAAA